MHRQDLIARGRVHKDDESFFVQFIVDRANLSDNGQIMPTTVINGKMDMNSSFAGFRKRGDKFTGKTGYPFGRSAHDGRKIVPERLDRHQTLGDDPQTSRRPPARGNVRTPRGRFQQRQPRRASAAIA